MNNKKNKSSKNALLAADDYNVKVMASLVPDEIIYNVKDYSIRKYDACLLFGDVSGELTSMTVKVFNSFRQASRICVRSTIKRARVVHRVLRKS